MRHIFLNLGHFQTHFFLLLYPTIVLTLEREGGGSYGDLLLPSTAGFVAFAALTLPAAWAGDRFPRPVLIALLFFGLAAGTGLAAAANGPLLLAAGLALTGAAAAIYHPVGLAALTEDSASDAGRVIAVNGVWGNMGVAAAPLIAALLAENLGWRFAFALPAVFALATGLAYVSRQRRQGRRRMVKAEPAPPVVKGGALLRVVLFLLVGGFCGGLIFNAVTVALPKLLAEQLPANAAGEAGVVGAGLLASLIFAVAAFSQLVTGRLLDRLPTRVLAGSLTSLQALFLLLLIGAEGWLAIAMALLLVTAIFAEIPVGDTLVRRVTPPQLRARAYGLLYVVSVGSTVATVPLISALYREGAGFVDLLWLLSGAAVLLAASAWGLPRGAADPQPVAPPRPAQAI